jgi:hypothetical protein
MTRFFVLLALAVAILALGSEQRHLPATAEGDRTEVLVTLASPPLAHARNGASRIEAEQRAFRRELERELPAARLRWRYRLVLNGFAVDLPGSQLDDLRRLAGVRDVYGSARYAPALDRSPVRIGAPGIWGAGLDSAGQGMKIGIVDTGIDHRHAFFDPSGYAMPPGFPKGQRAYTNAKVIVARAFPPRGAKSREARAAFDGEESSHGTHVAGIAAGNPRTRAEGRVISGVAPRAYIGNYKALTRTSVGISPNGNAPEIVAAIEAAVADRMDVINLSIGQPEIEPSRDVVALALDAAAAAGIVPVVAAGNDYASVGAGSISSPANAASAITVGAVQTESASDVHADFSSVGPTPISLRLKPDVAAPGVSILSSVPTGWASLSGTSMAAPHVAGAAALLRQRHPTWNVNQVKSALVQTGTNAVTERDGGIRPQFHGGGVIALNRADRPLVFATPSSVSFGLVAPGATVSRTVALGDAGGGSGSWAASLAGSVPRGARVTFARAVPVPGSLAIGVVAAKGAAGGEVSGYVVLRRGNDVRRIPFWGRVARARLARHKAIALARPGLHRATTDRRPALVSRYRYPENPNGLGVSIRLAGPELVYRVSIRRRIANFGVVVTQRARGSKVEPRVVAGLDENRLTGYAGLPVDHNPYLRTFREPLLAAAALSPARGQYAIVFDSETRAGAGRFTFRFWVNDVTRPTARLRARSIRHGSPLVVAVADGGAGIYPASLVVTVDGDAVEAALRRGLVRIPTGSLAPGRHRLRLRISDFQEGKNTENVARILPNTRVLATTVTVRP